LVDLRDCGDRKLRKKANARDYLLASQSGLGHGLFRSGGHRFPFHFDGFKVGMGDQQMPNQSLE
jgi:hypothetical protein